MRQYQQDFLDFVIQRNALRFGDFTLKSGRKSPYFFNTGLFNSGIALKQLGEFYAHAIKDWGEPFDMLFGPAYKGIPLVSATAVALARSDGIDVPYAFNRKEVKAHGEGGATVGAPLQGRVIIIDDVISAGLSIALSVNLIRQAGAKPAGVFIALDREERAQDTPQKATQAIQEQYRIPVRAIVNLTTMVDYLRGRPEYAEHLDAVSVYRRKYSVSEEHSNRV